jgi:GAF domain-containing protein
MLVGREYIKVPAHMFQDATDSNRFLEKPEGALRLPGRTKQVAKPEGLWPPQSFDAAGRRAMKGVGKFGEVMAGEKGKVSYDDVAARLEKIIHSGSQRKAITDFVCRELRKIPHYTWVGIYLVDGAELVLTSWSGPSATQHTRIPIGQGICGAAVSEKATVIVPDVSKDARYLQCFINTSAEIVVPILRNGAPIAEIDIDSDQLNAFGPTDKEFLEWVAQDLGPIL